MAIPTTIAGLRDAPLAVFVLIELDANGLVESCHFWTFSDLVEPNPRQIYFERRDAAARHRGRYS